MRFSSPCLPHRAESHREVHRDLEGARSLGPQRAARTQLAPYSGQKQVWGVQINNIGPWIRSDPFERNKAGAHNSKSDSKQSCSLTLTFNPIIKYFSSVKINKNHLESTSRMVWFIGWSFWNFTKCSPVIPWTDSIETWGPPFAWSENVYVSWYRTFIFSIIFVIF